MRKIRNSRIQTSNPGLLFARGVEQLINDQLYNPSCADRGPARRKSGLPGKESRSPGGNLFSEFLRQFVF
jgi:hypothetical protein